MIQITESTQQASASLLRPAKSSDGSNSISSGIFPQGRTRASLQSRSVREARIVRATTVMPRIEIHATERGASHWGHSNIAV